MLWLQCLRFMFVKAKFTTSFFLRTGFWELVQMFLVMALLYTSVRHNKMSSSMTSKNYYHVPNGLSYCKIGRCFDCTEITVMPVWTETGKELVNRGVAQVIKMF